MSSADGQILLFSRSALAAGAYNVYDVPNVPGVASDPRGGGIVSCQWRAGFGLPRALMIVAEMAKRLHFFQHHIENR